MAPLRIVSWNIGLRRAAIDLLKESHFDVALIQEARLPPDSWERALYSRGADVVQLSDRAELLKLTPTPQGRSPAPDQIAVSAPGIIAAAYILPKTGNRSSPSRSTPDGNDRIRARPPVGASDMQMRWRIAPYPT